ncbi:Scr1 family TA system antitoxin-like transcriptional regulator [Nocardiopsis changdeensis]|uniref:DUF5753 domain-containing protein n=1 Tax=Nocardiopsis changdeensis TaxID=2831969 RepID=A0A975KQI6_9ACTN|nr:MULTISPECIES: Scr1 family TA system antitoxin-like transcriptional regulator [Nocardiopsis]QUX26489.1 hypothetical protein KGD84_32855 [Nocardiopsis changdeensis]QYX40761.1 DUF5753 domain-containing protein [Nocardiopsis sp. MT53]
MHFPAPARAQAAARLLIQREVSRQEAAGPVDHWTPTAVPDYMQTREYAAAVLTATGAYTDEEAAQALTDRMARASLLRTVPHPRRILVTRAGMDREILPQPAMARQWAQLADLAHLDHVDLRVVPAYHPVHPEGFQILHGVDGVGCVVVEGPMGAYTPPGDPAEILDAYQDQFADLWEASDPYPG